MRLVSVIRYRLVNTASYSEALIYHRFEVEDQAYLRETASYMRDKDEQILNLEYHDFQ